MLVVFGFIVYVGLYSLWLKRSSIYGTLIGSLSGAMPPVVGYCAVSNNFDLGAIILLLIFSLWQMPHSYAIAIFRLQDYKNASIPVLPVVAGLEATKKHMILYVAAFVIATLMLKVNGYVGYAYFVIAGSSSIYWLWLTISGYKTNDDHVWARGVFIYSIILITIISFMMGVDYQINTDNTESLLPY